MALFYSSSFSSSTGALLYVRRFQPSKNLFCFSLLESMHIENWEQYNTKTFATTKRYGWFRRINGVLYELNAEDNQTILIYASTMPKERIAYLYARTDQQGLYSVSLQSAKESLFFERTTEQSCCALSFTDSRALLRNLISYLRLHNLQTIIYMYAEKTESLLRKEAHFAPEWLHVDPACQVLDFTIFLQGYAQPQVLLHNASDLKRYAEACTFLPYLQNCANKVGLPMQSLLNTSLLLEHFALQNVQKPTFHEPVLLKNTQKRATRLALLQALVDYAPEAYTYCSALPQEIIYNVLYSEQTPPSARRGYKEMIKGLHPEAQQDDYLYGTTSEQPSTLLNFFPVIDEIAVFLRLPRTVQAESARDELISSYWLELNKEGVLRANIPLTKLQEERLRVWLPTATLERQSFGQFWDILATVGDI